MTDSILIAGANGAGKTTFARQMMSLLYPSVVYLNADEIQREGEAFTHPVAAGRELLQRLDDREKSSQAFAIETTLSSRLYARRLEGWASQGYRTVLHFIELPSADHAVRRVALRTKAGGHSIPEADIRRRFRRGLELFQVAYRPLVDQWHQWASDDRGLRLVASSEDARGDEEREILLEAARRANWDALRGPQHLRSGRFYPGAEAPAPPGTGEVRDGVGANTVG